MHRDHAADLAGGGTALECDVVASLANAPKAQLLENANRLGA
jgi:hypothetical protein